MNNQNETECVFETADPLYNIIYLTRESWEDHIQIEHPELISVVSLIQVAVEEPDAIYPDPNYSTTHNYYYQHGDIFLNTYGRNLKVVVNRDLQGQIITAYCTPRRGEKTSPIYIKP